METRKWPAIGMAILTLCMGSCQDWGQMDPPAGTQVYPKLEQVANLTFDEETLNPDEIQAFAYPEGEIPSLVKDEKFQQVLHLSSGYIRLFNPLNKVKVQNAVSLTFWMKQANSPQIEGEENLKNEPDLTGAIFSFENENATQRMFFTANGWLHYEGVDGTYEDNNPDNAQTGIISPGEWHYIAISIKTDGYFVYVDGLKKIEKTITDFDYSKIVQFMASVPYIYIGYGSDTQTKEMWIDDINIYRNTITSKETKVPKKGTGGGSVEEEYAFPPKGTVGYYKLDTSFANSLNTNQSGELVTVESQSTPSDFEFDETRGNVWHQQEGWTEHANGWAYTQFSNPLKGVQTSEGISISMWINPPSINRWDQIFVLNDGTSKFWFNASGYLGYNGTGGWFDCQQDDETNALTVNDWTMVSINIETSGFTVYYNGEEKFSLENNAKYNSSGITDFQSVIDLFTGADKFYFGYETFWKAAPALIDDLFLISRSLTVSEIKNLYADTKKINGGVVENPGYTPSLKGYYPLDGEFTNAINTAQGGKVVTVETQATPSDFENDEVRGTVWHQQEGWADHPNGWAYLEFVNPLKGSTPAEGISISMWLNPPSLNHWDQVFVMNDGTSKFWFNPCGYLGYNGTAGWFDCQQDDETNAIPVNTWVLVTISITPTGFTVYYDGIEKFSLENNAKYNSSGITDFQGVIDLFTNSANFYLGYETFWKAAPALVDDIYICAAPMSQGHAAALYNATKK